MQIPQTAAKVRMFTTHALDPVSKGVIMLYEV